MSEVTKEDIAEVHKRIDKVGEHQNRTNIALARIETKLEMLPEPPDLPARPCEQHVSLKEDFDGHIIDHKETKQTWQRPVVRTLIDLVKMAVVAGVTWLFLRKE